MLVALGLPLNIATIILGCIFLVLFRDFGPKSIPTPAIAVLTEFFHADEETNVHQLPVSRYFISSLWMYQCSCTHIMSMLWSIAEAVSSYCWLILFKVLTLNVAICIVLLHLSNFCFCLSSIAYFSNTEARAPTSAGHAPLLPARGGMRLGHVV